MALIHFSSSEEQQGSGIGFIIIIHPLPRLPFLKDKSFALSVIDNVTLNPVSHVFERKVELKAPN